MSSATGSWVDYRIEFIPAIMWALGVAFAATIPIILVVVWLGYVPASTLAWVTAIVAVVLPLNVWISERQAGRLRSHIATVLSARPDVRVRAQDVRPFI